MDDGKQYVWFVKNSWWRISVVRYELLDRSDKTVKVRGVSSDYRIRLDSNVPGIPFFTAEEAKACALKLIGERLEQIGEEKAELERMQVTGVPLVVIERITPCQGEIEL